jgi:hypothetical protein
MVLSGGVMFWGQAARGPLGIDPNTLTFPTTGGGSAAGDDRKERFTILGSVAVDGNSVNVSFDQGVTGFATDGLGAFDNSALPERLNARLPGTFQWSYQGEPGSLLGEAKVKGGALQLYVTSMQVQTTGVWLGKRL